jgi:hypothetical protein
MGINVVAPGEVIVEKISLFNFDKSKEFSLLTQAKTIIVYEDVYKPTIYAEIAVMDYFDIINKFPIIGEEKIEISIRTPGADTPITYNLFIYSIVDYKLKKNTKSSTYTLKCVSEEQIFDTVNLVTKAYKAEISNIVPDILYNSMYSKKGWLTEESKGVQELIIPKMNPLKAIDFLRKRAVSIKYESSSFVFFENSRGFNFFTLERLFEENSKKIGTKVFSYNPALNVTDDTGNPANMTYKSFRNILSHTTTSKYDTIGKLQNGMFNNKTVSFDLLSKKINETNFIFPEKVERFAFIDKDFVLQNSAKFTGAFSSNEGHRFFLPQDLSRSETFIEDSLGAKVAFYNMIGQQKTLAKVYGDTTMAAGDVITCDFLTPTSTPDNSKPDDRTKGNYLVIQLAHAIRQEEGNKFMHEMSLGLLKGNY